MQIVLFEDELTPQLAPVALAKPTYAIGCASFRLIDLVRGLGTVRCVLRPHLQGVEEAGGRAPLSPPSLAGPVLLVNARLVPSMAAVAKLRELIAAEGEAIVISGQSVAAALLRRTLNVPTQENGAVDVAALLDQVRRLGLPGVDAKLPLLEYPHDILRYHLEHFRDSLEFRLRDGYRQMSDGLFVAEGVTLGPNLATDARNGPILIDAGASLGPFCYLTGPVYVGPGARLIENAVLKDGVALGERTKVGGEIEASIIEPLANKQHHGFLGHSYVGSWVNLGAGTSNSDLKNTYGTVNLDYGGRKVPTGMQFVGCFLGEYSKTAVNTGIFTGKTVGVCSMVYGYVTTNVPSFTNYARSFGQVTESPVEVAVSVQARMFTRRGVAQRPCDVQLLHDLYELTRTERTQFGEPLSIEPLSL